MLTMSKIVQLNPLFFVMFVVPFAVCSSWIIFSLYMRQQSHFWLSSYDLSLMYCFQWPSCVLNQVLTRPLTPTLPLSLFVQLEGWQLTLAMRELEELRVNLLLKEYSYVSYIIFYQSLILELKLFKLYMFWHVLCLVALFKGRYYTNYFTN
jgi:hypothetical protein